MTKSEWLAAIEAERKARAAIVEIGEDGPRPEQRAAARAWWGHVEQVLSAYVRQATGGNTLSPVPTELLSVLSTTAGYLAVGTTPLVIEVVTAPGRAEIGPTEKRHIEYAAAYIKAAILGKIDDPKYNKTIRILYGVAATTVRRWAGMKISPDIEWLVSEDPERLSEAVKAMGPTYQMAGGNSYTEPFADSWAALDEDQRAKKLKNRPKYVPRPRDKKH